MRNIDLKDQALESLKGNWGIAVATYLVYMLILSTPQFMLLVGGIATLILGGPLVLGFTKFSLSISRHKEGKLEQLFEGFNHFGVALGAYILMSIFIFLWTLLLIVPGIIAAIAYSMTFYIIADDPSIGIMEAISKSKKMMYGYKWKFFLLILSFIGWMILCILTLGIGFLFLGPYMQVSVAKFYDDIKKAPMHSENVRKLEE